MIPGFNTARLLHLSQFLKPNQYQKLLDISHYETVPKATLLKEENRPSSDLNLIIKGSVSLESLGNEVAIVKTEPDQPHPFKFIGIPRHLALNEEEVGEEKDERVKRIRVEELEDTDNSTVRVLTREEVEMFVTPIYELRNLVKENQEMKLGLLTLFHERLLQKGKINVLRETLRDQLTHPLSFIHPLPSFDSRQINICQAIPRYD